MRHFCTAGPVRDDIHYRVPPLSRIDTATVFSLIDGLKYFLLHAPRQSGKTSVMMALANALNETGRYKALYANIEAAQPMRDDVEGANRVIISSIAGRADRFLKDPYPEQFRRDLLSRSGHENAVYQLLAAWSSHSPLPIVLFLDEVDALVGDSLISLLRQLRSGYADRPTQFPQSIVLCGVRNLQDYRIHGSKEVITGGSAFNIKAESLRLGNFTEAEVRQLYEEHTRETGQTFEEAVYPLVWNLTRGQPWLVNALAWDACFKLQTDRTQPITADLIHEAKERLILSRQTHLDQLSDKLSEARVRKVIEPILSGSAQLEAAAFDDDTQYCIDLGLIERRKGEGLVISNAIYREVIPRELTYQTQIALEVNDKPEQWYVNPDGRIDMIRLLDNFQQFFRENSESWLERFTYREAGPQLLIQAFLQRIVNGGGRIDREYALGRRRTDLLVVWKHPNGTQRAVIECKIQRRSLEQTIAEGLPQTADHMDRSGADEGHLVIFNREAGASWEEKIFSREAEHEGKRIRIWGM
ncbi:MAG: ATP-binding protein [Bryobacteraceae bacterium]